MPRLNSRDYLDYRLQLMVEWWDEEGGAFFELTPPQQRDLHDYFAPAEPLTDREVLEHRKRMTRAFPSLPHKAGRAFQALVAARDRPVREYAIPGKGAREVFVKVLVRPNLDVDRIARLLIRLAATDPNGVLLKRARRRRRS